MYKYVLIVYPTLTFRIPPAYIICGIIFGANGFMVTFLTTKNLNNTDNPNNKKMADNS